MSKTLKTKELVFARSLSMKSVQISGNLANRSTKGARLRIALKHSILLTSSVSKLVNKRC